MLRPGPVADLTRYAFYYIAVAMLTGAFGILNSTQSFLGVIFAFFSAMPTA